MPNPVVAPVCVLDEFPEEFAVDRDGEGGGGGIVKGAGGTVGDHGVGRGIVTGAEGGGGTMTGAEGGGGTMTGAEGGGGTVTNMPSSRSSSPSNCDMTLDMHIIYT